MVGRAESSISLLDAWVWVRLELEFDPLAPPESWPASTANRRCEAESMLYAYNEAEDEQTTRGKEGGSNFQNGASIEKKSIANQI